MLCHRHSGSLYHAYRSHPALSWAAKCSHNRFLPPRLSVTQTTNTCICTPRHRHTHSHTYIQTHTCIYMSLPSYIHTFPTTSAQAQTPKERDITGAPHLLSPGAFGLAHSFQEPALRPWMFPSPPCSYRGLLPSQPVFHF